MAEPRPTDRTPIACTVVARNYLPAATVLARSFRAHHPDTRFVIGVVDAPWEERTEQADHLVVGPAAFGIDQDSYLRMATAYSVTELATAVKPYLLRRLREQADVVIYLDPDIMVFAPMPELVELATEHQLVLTPHFLSPLPRDGREPTEAMIMGSGIFNLGFVATGPGSGAFLDFWAERLRHDAIVAPEAQLFTDQRWVDQVPALFRHTVLRDPGFNVAYWNAHERPVQRVEDGTLTAGGRPLRFFHFSGYRPEKPWLLTHHTPRKPRVLLSAEPVLRALCADYRTALQQAGYAESLDAVPYGFAELADGTGLTPTMRRLFRREWVRAERKDEVPPPHGFGADGGAALRAWLADAPEHIPTGTGLNRLAMAVWEARQDLRAAFPQPYGRDAASFRAWCQTSGAVEEVLQDWAIPTEPADLTEPADTPGVNVLGYLTAELGVGEMGRIVHDAIRAAGVPVASVVEDRLVANRTALRAPTSIGEPVYPVSLLCVNADQTAAVLASHPDVGHHRYRIGLWAWELAEFPEPLHQAYELVDEVWTISEFCREAIASHSPVPVKTIPVPVRDPGEPARTPRAPGDPVRFLFAFDYFSVGQRKNPWGLVQAFQRAFPDRDDVRLVLKAINADQHPEPAERLRVLVAEDRRIELIERYLSVAELDELYERSDCYVSLHRSEGFGLTVAEAMVRGLPVICTDYSSTTEFVTADVGWPVPYQLIPVGRNNGPYPPAASWADPDLDAAAKAMRQVADSPDEAHRRGLAAREHILRTRSMAAAADWMRGQLAEAHQRWRAGAGRPRLEADPLRPLRDAKQALLWRAETATPSRLPLAPAMRRAVLRAIDHYDVHQRTVLGALADGMESTTGQLLARLNAVEAQLAAAEAAAERTVGFADRLDAVQRTVEQLAAVAPDTELAVRELDRSRRVTERAVDDLRADLDAAGHTAHEMFRARDARFDDTQERLVRASADVAVVHEAARLRHAPIPTGADVVLCDAGALLLPVDAVVLPWLAHHRAWERGEADLMAELIKRQPPDATFVDIGAHVGYHTLRLLQRSTGLGRVVAVEANPVNADYLARNVAANLSAEAAALVTVLPVAAWDSAGEVRLVQAEAGNSGDHRVRTDGTDGVVVPAVRLDQRPELAGRRVDLVKVDLQGRDHRALAGLSDLLERDRPQVICEFCPEAVEELGDDPGQVLAGYRKLGYAPVPVADSGPADGEYTDQELVDEGRNASTGFITLWLRPT